MRRIRLSTAWCATRDHHQGRSAGPVGRDRGDPPGVTDGVRQDELGQPAVKGFDVCLLSADVAHEAGPPVPKLDLQLESGVPLGIVAEFPISRAGEAIHLKHYLSLCFMRVHHYFPSSRKAMQQLNKLRLQLLVP